MYVCNIKYAFHIYFNLLMRSSKSTWATSVLSYSVLHWDCSYDP